LHRSLDWSCPQCGVRMRDALPAPGSTGNAEQLMAEVKSASASPSNQKQKVQTEKSLQSTNHQEQGNNGGNGEDSLKFD
jgi:hypothetical protein